MDLLQNFRNKQIIRGQIQCPDQLNVWLDHCEYVIHAQFDKGSRRLYKLKKRKKQTNLNFQNAIQNLNREQKVQFYLRIVHHLQTLSKGKQEPPFFPEMTTKPIQGECQCRSFNLKIWKQKKIRLNKGRHQIMVQNEKDKKIKTYELRDYVLRKSKIKDRHTLVLQSINSRPHQKSRTVHIAFKSAQSLRKWFQLIKEAVEFCEWLNVKDMYNSKEINHSVVTYFKGNSNAVGLQENIASSQVLKGSGSSARTQSNKQSHPHKEIEEDKLFQAEQLLQKDEKQIYGRRKTFIDHLVDDDCTDFQDFFEQIQNQTEKDVQQKKGLDFFHKLMPEYELDQLTELGGFQVVAGEQEGIKVLQNSSNPSRFKVVVRFSSALYGPKQIFCMISEPRLALQVNDNIEEQSIKTLLKSENSAIMYQTLKAYNKFYRPRDFIFVRHAFSHRGNFYLVDKSLDNINFPPFMTLVRGEKSIVWGVIKQQNSQQLSLIGDCVIVNAGLLNNQQQTNLSLKYLRGFKLLLAQQPNREVESTMFDIEWNIDERDINRQYQEIRVRRKTIQIQKQKLQALQPNRPVKALEPNRPVKANFTKNPSSSIQKAYTSKSPQKPQPQQIQYQQPTQKSLQTKTTYNQVPLSENRNVSGHHTQLQITRRLDKEGYVIVDGGYIKGSFPIRPMEKQLYKQCPNINGHAIWKGDWLRDNNIGGFAFVNQKKIEDQKRVLKFILTKIGKNILSGKGVLNISLPVDIFVPQSNLERLFISMAYAPKLLQNLNQKPLIQKLMKTVAFGLSNSVLYLNMEKPFNPILGQTFQCWINGCPGYGQQISHHPPIASLMFYGRGYRVTCQLQSKVQLHMNSGCGINEGIYKILFNDGVQISFMTPSGQISGLTYGDRKFNLVGKSYYWIEKQRVFVELNYDAAKKGFFSKQQRPSDYFEGRVLEVASQFFHVFPKTKRREPTDKEKVKEIGRFDGIWNKYINFNDQQVFNFDTNPPVKVEYDCYPLPSDANWREDIHYRRLNKTTRAQTQKQRLQVIQRTDRKLREKHGKK